MAIDKDEDGGFLGAAMEARKDPGKHRRLCAWMINRFWHRRGYKAEARVEDGRIVSNIVCGWPTKKAGQ